MAEQFVQVSPDSTGKKVRTLEVTALQPDGTSAVVSMQVVSIADAQGNLVSLSTTQETMITLLQTTNALLRAVVLQLSFINSPRTIIDDLTPFYADSPSGTLS